MIAPWVCMRRGTDAAVPIVPGFVSEIVVPSKSATSSVLLRALRTMSLYVRRNCAKSVAFARFTFGTTSERVPSLRSTSMARPRFTSSRSMRVGCPSCCANAEFMRGNCFIAFTIAQPTMCVYDAFGWPVNERWWLMTRRFSSRTLTGMLRMEVAVGTESDASMFVAIFPAAPRRGTTFWSDGTGVGRDSGTGTGAGTGAEVWPTAMSSSSSSASCGS